MDMSKLSEDDLMAIANNDMSKVSEEGLMMLSGEAPPKPERPADFWQGDMVGPKPKQGVMSAVGDIASVAGRALDYPGGLIRTGVADAISPSDMVTREDYKKALKGEAPTSSEYLERDGVQNPLGARSVGGFALDVLSDPLTYATAGLSAVGKLRPASKAATKAGTNLYKSGLKALDIEAAKYGKEPVSDLLMKEGITGSYSSIEKQMDDLGARYMQERDAILKAADEAGGQVSMQEAMAPLKEKISQIRKSEDPNLQAVADAMNNDMQKYLELEKAADPLMGTTKKVITPSQGSGFKSSTYNQLPDSAYSQAAQTPVGKDLTKTKARGLKESVESAVEKSSGKMSADKLRELNDNLGRVLTTEDKAAVEAAKELRKNNVTSVDALVTGAGAMVNPTMTIPALALKKAVDFSKMTYPRTVGGKALKDLGESGALDKYGMPLLYSPWSRIEKYNKED